MTILKTVVIIFLILEASNVLTLYFAPASRYANGIGVFNAWEKSKADPDVHQLVQYLVNWVAGTKLIFIFLLIVILLRGDEQTLQLTAFAMTVSIASFFWRLFPMIRKMDSNGQITPPNYSVMLGWMIFAFIMTFVIALVMSLI